MTYQEWLTCTDPAKMLRSLGLIETTMESGSYAIGFQCPVSKTNRANLIHWIEACQLAFDKHRTWEPIDDLPFNVRIWSSKEAVDTFNVRCAFIRDIWGNPFHDFDPNKQVCLRCGFTAEDFRMSGIRCGPTNFRIDTATEEGYISVWIAQELSSWRSWQDGMLVKMAQQIHADRDFGSLPIFADALEEAGCANAEIIDHLRNKEKCAWCGESGEQIWSSEKYRGTTVELVKVCSHCEGTGKLSAMHVFGCWVLALFLP